ncbi:hypothetical protein HK405_006677, partial [Cladochytrium tenue]
EGTTWVRKTAPDGTIYYMNRFTGEASYPAPMSGTDSLQGSPRAFMDSPRDSSGSTLLASQHSPAGSTLASRTNSSNANSTLVLPPGWTSFRAEDGSFVYFHPGTKETSWVPPAGTMTAPLSPQSSSPVPGQTLGVGSGPDGRRSSTISSVRQAAMNEGRTNPSQHNLEGNAASIIAGDVRRGSLDSDSGRMTWAQLTLGVAKAIENLEVSAAKNQRDRFIPQSSAIVESIRVMLFASGTARRDAPHIESHRQLRTHYKSIMSTLSSLVMAAKLASSVWPPPDAINRMVAATAEVSTAVKNFVTAAQEVGVEIKQDAIPPPATSQASRSEPAATVPSPRQTEAQPVRAEEPSAVSAPAPVVPAPVEIADPALAPNIEVVHSLESFTTSIVKSIGTLALAIQSGTCDSGRLITDVRQIVMEVGNFLAVVDDLPLDALSDDVTVDFKVNRLALYNAISELVMATSGATGQFPPSNAVEQVVISMDHVDKSVKDLLVTTKFLLEEREARERNNLYEVMKYGVHPQPTGYGDMMQQVVGAQIIGTGYGSYPMGFPSSPSNALYAQAPMTPTQGMMTVMPTGVVASAGASVMEIPNRYMYGRSSSLDQGVLLSNIQAGLDTITGRPVELEPEEQLAFMAQTGDPRRGSARFGRNVLTGMAKLDIASGGGKPGDASSGGAPESSTPTATTAGPVRKPWYLEYDYKPEDIMFNNEGKVKGGKLPALVERLTLHDTVDSFYVQAFLLTYRSFTSTKEFYELLKKRFEIQAPTGLNELELDDWKRNKKKPICVRVFNVMKQWVETYYQEDDEDKEVLQEMRAFASVEMQEEDARLGLQLSSHLLKLIERREQGLMKKILVTSMGKDVPAPILPRNLKKLKFLDLDPLEIARQLTIIESKVFNRIQPVEFLRKAWSDKESEVAVNVKTMIAMSNQVSGWVAQSILSEKDHQKRKRLIVHFIAIAEKCRTLNNFNTLMAILAGLNTAPIHRLKRTWELVPAKNMGGLEALRETMDSTKNFSRYRETLHSINPPCVPFLGFYLTDLTFIEDGSPNFLNPGGAAALAATTSATGESAPPQQQLVNFGKRMKTSEVIREVQQFQSAPYLFTQVPELQEFLRESFAETVDETDLYNLSLSLEPREREDEKIARMLTESGFL